MTKYLIIDDEPIAHDIIQGYCDLLPGMQLEKNCYDAIDALDYLREHKVDLIFLDLNMPKLKGFAFLKTLSQAPKVIVTTAYKEFALEGYELNLVDYLLKPFSFERFLKAIQKVNLTDKTIAVKSNVRNENKEETIFLRSNKKHIQVDVNNILFLESAGNYVKVVTDDETIMVREKISDLIDKLPAGLLVKTHKSFAVAIAKIKSIEGNRIFIHEHIVPIGKMYRENISHLLK